MVDEPEEDRKPFTIEQFYKFLKEEKLMASKCMKCNSLMLPPRPICNKCLSQELSWKELGRKGKLLTYTIIRVPPVQFEAYAPYVYCIVDLEDGPRLPGIIRDIDPKNLKIGLDLEVFFETDSNSTWPQWPRYFFKVSNNK